MNVRFYVVVESNGKKDARGPLGLDDAERLRVAATQRGLSVIGVVEPRERSVFAGPR